MKKGVKLYRDERRAIKDARLAELFEALEDNVKKASAKTGKEGERLRAKAAALMTARRLRKAGGTESKIDDAIARLGTL